MNRPADPAVHHAVTSWNRLRVLRPFRPKAGKLQNCLESEVPRVLGGWAGEWFPSGFTLTPDSDSPNTWLTTNSDGRRLWFLWSLSGLDFRYVSMGTWRGELLMWKLEQGWRSGAASQMRGWLRG